MAGDGNQNGMRRYHPLGGEGSSYFISHTAYGDGTILLTVENQPSLELRVTSHAELQLNFVEDTNTKDKNLLRARSWVLHAPGVAAGKGQD